MAAPEAYNVARTLRAMEVLAQRPCSAPELARELAINVKTARRILRRFETEGYATPRPDDPRRRYGLTLRVVALAGLVLAGADWLQETRPLLDALRSEVGGSCHLAVPSYLSALCVVHSGEEGQTCRPHLRELVPCHCTAAGKALLAWRESWRDAVLARALPSLTERTITGPEYLRRELARTRSRGYSIEDREFHPSARGIAAPVFSEGGEAIAAVAVVMPVADLGPELYAVVAQAVMQTARHLSAKTPAG
jgi:DNA-binding IclR family transcriptional regulator